MKDLRVYHRISEAVGWTPMVRLGRALPDTACEVYAKLEFLNPMGSTKDRIARHFIEQAMRCGKLQIGGTVVEASSGNTAMGLAMMATLEGLHLKIIVRKETSPEKLCSLRALGAELILVDGDRPPGDPESFNRKAPLVAAAIPGAWFPDQHNNRANNDAHYRTTGPEILGADGRTRRCARRRHRHRRHALRDSALFERAEPRAAGRRGGW